MKWPLGLVRPSLCIGIVWVPGIHETGTAGARRCHLLDRFSWGVIDTAETHARFHNGDTDSMEVCIVSFEKRGRVHDLSLMTTVWVGIRFECSVEAALKPEPFNQTQRSSRGSAEWASLSR